MEVIRSEQPSLDSLAQTIDAIGTTNDPRQLVILLLLASDLYADAQCRCEEKEASYGVGGDESGICYVNVSRAKDDMLKMFEKLVGVGK